MGLPDEIATNLLNDLVIEPERGSYERSLVAGSPLTQAILWVRGNEAKLRMGASPRDLASAFTRELPRILRDQDTPQDRQFIQGFIEQKIRAESELAAK
jgi:hypothetical protein